MFASLHYDKLKESNLKLKEIYTLTYLVGRFEGFYFNSQTRGNSRQAGTTINCFTMSQNKMAEEMQVSRQTVNSHIKKIIAAGFGFKLFHSMNKGELFFAWVFTHDEKIISKLRAGYYWHEEYKCWYPNSVQPESKKPQAAESAPEQTPEVIATSHSASPLPFPDWDEDECF